MKELLCFKKNVVVVGKISFIYCFDLFVDKDVLCVGGWLNNVDIL